MSVSKRLRYEILRRDSHTCRYCGESAPDVKLAIDHVIPVALGGPDDPGNLVTACEACNSGKSASSPDAPIVEDVSTKAVKWAMAIQRVVEEECERLDHKDQLIDYFDGEWYGRHEIPRYKSWQYELPDDWDETVWRFYGLGLRVPMLDDAIDIAHKSNAKNKFRYFCGVCWTKIRAIQDAAFEIVEADDGA